jgi:porphobilinogen synthase
MQMAVLHARAGVDLVAPSDMMDGRIGAIRKALDAADFTTPASWRTRRNTPRPTTGRSATPWAAPRRRARGCSARPPTSSIPANRREALIELALDEAEGADIVMVKPAGPYLDIIREVRNATNKPVAAYQVSGEYAQTPRGGAARLARPPAAGTSRCSRSSAPAPT